MYLGILSIIIIAVVSYGLFYFIQKDNEKTIRESIFAQQLDQQDKSTESIAQHIGSDLRLITSMLQGLAESTYLQNETFSGDKVNKLLDEKFKQLNSVTRVDSILITDEDGVIAIQKAWEGLETFVNIDISSREYMELTKKAMKPIYSDGFSGIDGIYRIAVTQPIISLDSGRYIGTVVANLPAIQFFRNYGNVEDITAEFLVSFDKKGNLLAVGASSELVGKNFFGNETQSFINRNSVLNNLTRYLLAGNSGHATYDYGRGERLNTQSPIFVEDEPIYFLQVVTPTDRIYSNINSVLFTESAKMLSLLTGTTVAIIILVFVIRRWYSALQEEVGKRTRELNESNYNLQIANESLKKKDDAQIQFINVAAHELRTPIQPIINAIYLLSSSKVGSEKRSMYVDIIKRNTEKLGRLAEDILDVARIESDKLKLTIEQFNLYDLILNTVEEYKKNAQVLYSELDINYKSSSKLIIVKGDKVRLGQVMSILLDNAAKFTKSGSIYVTSQIKSNNVQVMVKDTGTGIDSEILPQLFTKFVTRSDRGTGLGLFIAKNIVEAHRGLIWAENNIQQKGAIFIFTLPLSSQEDNEDEND
jgi:signal transduction histidine kinase